MLLAAVPLLSALPGLLFPVLQAPVQVRLLAFLLQQAVLLPLAFLLLPQVLPLLACPFLEMLFLLHLPNLRNGSLFFLLLPA